MKVTTIVEDGNKRITTIAETSSNKAISQYENRANEYNSASSYSSSSLARQIASVESDTRQYGDH